MKCIRVSLALVCVLLLSTLARADDAPESITVAGDIAKPIEWNGDKIKKDLAADVTTVSYTGRDGKHTSTAVPLVSLLKASGLTTDLKPDPKADPKVKHSELHYVVTVEGKDGYYAVFSMAELMPDAGNRKVYLALDTDGKPLTTTEGPMKLIASDDGKPARWVHSVTKISLVKVEPPK